MSQHVGTRLGFFEVQSLIGAGGMGKVYKAIDTRLGRDVALKILLDEFASDRERMVRLEREARILASLNHPNIASIYSVEECDGVHALVLEYVDGPTLAERIRRGPIAIDEALSVAGQITQALHYAHERGIIHRDLKPANVKLTADGTVKVLDFGLAKALETDRPAADPDASPTASLSVTCAGAILGTAAYMSPEQVRGRPAGRRADIWAFGVLLFEMLAGRKLFDGETVSESLASVLKEPADWSRLPAETPPSILRLLHRCLERDPDLRLNDIADASLDIRDAEKDSGELPKVKPRWRAAVPWLLSVVTALAVIIGAAGWWRASHLTEPQLMMLPVDLGPNADLTSSWGASAVISPDGTRLVYVVRNAAGNTQLATRRLQTLETAMIPGTDGAAMPFFSPDSLWVGFFADRKLKKVSVTGGAAVALCSTGAVSGGGSWGEDGTIVAALRGIGGLSRVSSAGGEPQQVTQPDEKGGENSHRWPQILPGGEAILYTAGLSLSMEDTGSVVVQSLKNGRRKVLRRGGYYGRYVPTGVLLYAHHGTIFAEGFDAATWDLAGTPVPVLDHVVDSPLSGGAQFDFSRSGILIYTPGKSIGQTSVLMWLDSSGRLQPLPAAPGIYFSPRISPDGTKIALIRVIGQSQDLWVYDWRRDIMTRLTANLEREVFSPIWTPDGKHIVFTVDQAIHSVRADGSSSARRLTDGTSPKIPFSFSPDGKKLAFIGPSPGKKADIWILPMERDGFGDLRPGKAEPFVQTRSTHWAPAFSPDGRWIAYSSTESGPFEIYVRPFPASTPRWQVSSGGGGTPVWSPTTQELFYRTPDGTIMAVTYSANRDAFVPEGRRLASRDFRLAGVPIWSNFDIAPDGKRLLVLAPPPGEEKAGRETDVYFLLNYFDELRRRVSVGAK